MSTKAQIVAKSESKTSKIPDISICDVTKNNTSEILQKMEFQVPIYLQGYTDLFTKYLHSFNTAFGTCRISEKQFYDKLGIDHTVMKEFADYLEFVKNMAIIQIETCSKFIQDYIEFRIATIDSIDKSMSSALDYYTKAMPHLKKE